MLLTVGHGTLEADAFAALLAGAGVAQVVDVRRYPGSRRHPHFGRDRMAAWLADAGIGYRWEEELGGRRRGDGAAHAALRDASFRAYAAHMETPDFHQALRAVLEQADITPTTVLCAESVWWRCHRRLIADAAVLLHDTEVRHLMHDGTLQPHRPTDGVRAAGDRLLYDGGAPSPGDQSAPSPGDTRAPSPGD